MNNSCSCDNFANEENDQRYVTLIRYLSITNNKNLIIISVDATKIKYRSQKIMAISRSPLFMVQVIVETRVSKIYKDRSRNTRRP